MSHEQMSAGFFFSHSQAHMLDFHCVSGSHLVPRQLRIPISRSEIIGHAVCTNFDMKEFLGSVRAKDANISLRLGTWITAIRPRASFKLNLKTRQIHCFLALQGWTEIGRPLPKTPPVTSSHGSAAMVLRAMRLTFGSTNGLNLLIQMVPTTLTMNRAEKRKPLESCIDRQYRCWYGSRTSKQEARSRTPSKHALGSTLSLMTNPPELVVSRIQLTSRGRNGYCCSTIPSTPSSLLERLSTYFFPKYCHIFSL